MTNEFGIIKAYTTQIKIFQNNSISVLESEINCFLRSADCYGLVSISFLNEPEVQTTFYSALVTYLADI